jgi:hypothetical protein
LQDFLLLSIAWRKYWHVSGACMAAKRVRAASAALTYLMPPLT